MNNFKKIFIRNFVNKLIFPYIRGSNRLQYFEKLKDYQWWNQKSIEEFQRKKLFRLIDFAYENNSYYRNIIEDRNIDYSKNTIFQDLKKIPVLTKQDLRDSFDELKSNNFDEKYYKNTSGGSTGRPVVFLQDSTYRDWNAAGKLLFYDWAGAKPEDKIIKLWGSKRDVEKGGQGLRGFLVRHLVNTKVLDTFKMSDSDMENYLQIINEERPEVIEAYVQSIFEMANYIREKDKEVFSPNGLITSAGMLYSDVEDMLEEIFKTSVYNRYGSREVGDIACSCCSSRSLHINQFFNLVEIKKNDTSDKFGDVLVTNLHNKIMPLIRYKIGDKATKKVSSDCECGRELEQIERLKGREVNMFINKEGERIDGEYFTHLMYYKNGVERFQFVQKQVDKIILKVQPKQSLSKKEEKSIRRKVKGVMGKDCELIVEEKDRINPTDSGKHLYTISRVDKD
ncbi:MAG: phenylacetate--CoA ligase family protein [Candidatus Paceibacteria bacterium]